MEWKEQEFAFEGKSQWIGGQEIKLFETAEARWYTCNDTLVRGESIFDIVYRLPGGRYFSAYLVSIEKVEAKLPNGKTKKVWADDLPVKIGPAGWGNLIMFFRDSGKPLPADLQKRLDEGIQADARVRPRDELSRLRFQAPDLHVPAHAVDLQRKLGILKNLLVAFIQCLRIAENEKPDYASVLEPTFAYSLCERYRVAPDHWWGDEFSIPPDYVDVLELPWPQDHHPAIEVLKIVRRKICPWIFMVESRGPEPVEAERLTKGERKFAKQLLVDMKPDLELDAQAFLRALPQQRRAPPDKAIDADDGVRFQTTAPPVEVTPGVGAVPEAAAQTGASSPLNYSP